MTLVDDTLDLDRPYPLSQAQRSAFRRDGFIRLKHALSPETLRKHGSVITDLTIALNTQTRPLSERSTYDRAFLQVMNLWEHDETVRAFVFGRRMARIAAELLGVGGVRLYHDQALYKEPGGGLTPAHADQYYWPFSSDRTVTAWIPLQDTPLRMGPLGFYPRSQAVVFGRDLGISDHSESEISRAMAEANLPFDVEPFDLGDVSFHLGWTFHRAGANLTQTPRSAMTMIYMDSEMRLTRPENPAQANDHARWTPGARVGEIVDTPLNPVLYDRAMETAR